MPQFLFPCLPSHCLHFLSFNLFIYYSPCNRFLCFPFILLPFAHFLSSFPSVLFVFSLFLSLYFLSLRILSHSSLLFPVASLPFSNPSTSDLSLSVHLYFLSFPFLISLLPLPLASSIFFISSLFLQYISLCFIVLSSCFPHSFLLSLLYPLPFLFCIPS